MLLRKILIILIFFIFLNNKSFSVEIKIKAEVDNIIITNVDIENEKKYLIFLNPKLQELSEKRKDNIAKNSLIREIIKEKELKKFFDINKKIKLVDKIEKNLLLKKNINKIELINLLNKNNMDYVQMRKKLKIEAFWNQLVYRKYFKNLKIDENVMRKKIEEEIKNKQKKYEFNLSEIVFEEKTSENYEITLKKVKESIRNIGFENTANVLSISNTSKNGGLIGWINEIQISEKLKNKIKKLKVNQVSKPIKIANGYLLIKLNSKREIKQKINIEKELKSLIDYEKNRQLNNFSIIYYKRLKQNTKINEY